MIKTKNETVKSTLVSSFKNYRNIITTLTRQSKKNHLQNFFAKNTNNIKKNMGRYKQHHQTKNNK